jgi:hypothetical protein
VSCTLPDVVDATRTAASAGAGPRRGRWCCGPLACGFAAGRSQPRVERPVERRAGYSQRGRCHECGYVRSVHGAVLMVGRRPTVRFRNGAPAHGQFSSESDECVERVRETLFGSHGTAIAPMAQPEPGGSYPRQPPAARRGTAWSLPGRGHAGQVLQRPAVPGLDEPAGFQNGAKVAEPPASPARPLGSAPASSSIRATASRPSARVARPGSRPSSVRTRPASPRDHRGGEAVAGELGGGRRHPDRPARAVTDAGLAECFRLTRPGSRCGR